MTDTVFFTSVNQSLSTECRRLCDFTDELDRSPKEKKERIAEYKCAKYRYAGVSNIHAIFYHSHRVAESLAHTHYLPPHMEPLFLASPAWVEAYKAADETDRPDIALMGATLAFTEDKITENRQKRAHANDWEAVELDQRLGGYEFAKACLLEAWNNRTEVKL